MKHAIEDEIREINANPRLSEQFKYRNSVRLFDRVDEMKLSLEIDALANKWEAAAQRIVRTQRRKGVDERTAWAPVRDVIRDWLAARSKLAAMERKAFMLTVFAPWTDVCLRERVELVDHFAARQARYAFTRFKVSLARKLGSPHV